MIIQLKNSDGEDIGLYTTERSDMEKIQYYFNDAFNNSIDEDPNEQLAKEGIYRIFVDEEIYINY